MSDLTDRLDALPDLVRMLRQARELSLREAADEIGIPFNTLTRFERRMNDCQLSNVMAILRWVEGRDGVAR